MKIKFTELKTKTRKGIHIYIKSQGKKGAYYKFQKNTPVDIYTQYYRDTKIKGRKRGSLRKYIQTYMKRLEGTKTEDTEITRQADKYIQKIHKNNKLMSNIRAGITTSNIQDALSTNNQQLHTNKKTLLKNLVLDPELLELIARNENFQKIKNRLEYRISFLNKNNKTIGTSGTFNKTPEQVITEMKRITRKGEKVYRLETPKLSEKLKTTNYQKYQHQNDGTIKTVKIQIIFRKAR